MIGKVQITELKGAERELATLTAEVEGMLNLVPPEYRIVCREGGAFENPVGSVCLSIAKMAEQLAAMTAERDRLKESSPYWLLHSLVGELEPMPCRNGSDIACSGRDLCVTEYCNPCAARWWMNMESARSKS